MGLPPHVLDRLGPDPLDVSGEDACTVLSGGGMVAKAGPAALLARERLVLEELAPRVPVALPPLVEGGNGWILLEAVGDAATRWTRDDVEACLADLGTFHGAFVGDDVLDDPRLRRPLGDELDSALGAARDMADLDSLLPGATALAADPTPLLDRLAGQPDTLLHGDPWPGNVRRPAVGRRVWVDWSGTARGPAALDVATWVDMTPWAVDDLAPSEEQVGVYARTTGIERPDDFARAVDAATVLWFLLVDAARLEGVRHDPQLVERLLAPRRAAMDRLGLGP